MTLQVAAEGFSDRDKAKALHVQIEAKLKELCALMDEVLRSGMRTEFQIQPDQFNRHTIQRLDIVKVMS